MLVVKPRCSSLFLFREWTSAWAIQQEYLTAQLSVSCVRTCKQCHVEGVSLVKMEFKMRFDFVAAESSVALHCDDDEGTPTSLQDVTRMLSFTVDSIYSLW